MLGFHLCVKKFGSRLEKEEMSGRRNVPRRGIKENADQERELSDEKTKKEDKKSS